jgi:hypothetical protein
MTRLNNEICELNSQELDRVSGGDNRVLWGAQKVAQENYARIRLLGAERSAAQNAKNNALSEFHSLGMMWWA